MSKSMQPFVRASIGGAIGYLAGLYLTHPTYGPVKHFSATSGSRHVKDAPCGREFVLFFGDGGFVDFGPCDPGLVCQAGVCVEPAEVTTRKTIHAGIALGGALIGYFWSAR